VTFEVSTEVTRLAAAASAVRDALERLDGSREVEMINMGVIVRVSVEAETARTVERIAADVSKRYGIPIEIDWR
jgi:hypothetical protein